MNKQDIDLLREELELLMAERTSLLNIVGAAAALVANLQADAIPLAAAQDANLLSSLLNGLNEETLKDALDAANSIR